MIAVLQLLQMTSGFAAVADECAAGVAGVACEDKCIVLCVAGAHIRTAVDTDEVLQLLQMSSPEGQGGEAVFLKSALIEP